MPNDLILTSRTDVELKPAPIEPSWIIEGNPVATNCTLSRSADGMASTIIWQCTEGKFNWHYDIDETICILEGSVVIESAGMPAKRYGPGDVIFFKDGASARWHVEGHIRKIAFCRRTQPRLVGLGVRVYAKLRSMLLPSANRPAQSLLGAN
ncbi:MULTISPECIES: cupin domain-containing protein [Rhodopseudomonas]|jgi:uncharacterized cupin superfamily protein|uniref:DUF861 domain-containing protein n=1 Tax=Rhodopseudomonas palustris TaxID=1076 RepID=A0AAX3DZA8_RHOPL|nr:MULTISPECIES: cupin domain-containing protein [Rhodopseudomonas]NEW99647.1 DUF861 domain-containing protein [Rhodopseudomonas sp. BR0G17]UYO39495.1 DUF861 domain-containing protein [Rhodopseudomonas palustris]